MNIDSVATIVGASDQSKSKTSDHAEMQRLKRVVGEITGRVFFEPILSQARSSSLKSKYGHGGRGEDVFGAQLDGLLSEQVGNSMKSGISNAMFTRLAEQQQRLIDGAQARMTNDERNVSDKRKTNDAGHVNEMRDAYLLHDAHGVRDAVGIELTI